MKKLVLTLAAMTSLAAAVPANAQSFFTTYPNNGGALSSAYQYSGSMAYASCQVLKVRKHLPDGRIVIRKERTCS